MEERRHRTKKAGLALNAVEDDDSQENKVHQRSLDLRSFRRSSVQLPVSSLSTDDCRRI